MSKTSRTYPITVIIPACNETETIARTLQELTDTYPIDQIIVAAVDRNPQTGEITGTTHGPTARTAAATNPNIEIVDGSGGLTAGIRKALPHTKPTNTLIIMDADGSHNPDIIPKLAEHIHNGYDIAVGGYPQERTTPLRWALTQLSRTATKLRLPRKTWGIRHPQSGYFATRPELLTEAAEKAPPNCYKILVAAFIHNPPLKTITEPTSIRPRTGGTSNLNLKVILADIKLLTQTR